MSSHRPRVKPTAPPMAGGLMNLSRDSPLPKWGSSSSFMGSSCFQRRSALGKGTAILIGMLLLFALLSIKKSEAGLRGNHHRKLGGHDLAFIDPENPQVAKVIQEDSALNQQQDIVPPTKPPLIRPKSMVLSPEVARQKRIQVNREVAQQLPPPQGLYAMHALDIDGNDVSLGDFAGKVLLVVNVASACGYTEQNYKGLQALYEKYGSYGLEIIGFPSNQFGGQEPGTEQHIKQYVTSKYNVTFRMMSKVDVNGPNAHPIFKYLKKQLPADQGGGGGIAPGNDLVWNFNKFLIDKHGRPVSFYYQNFDATRLEGDVFTYLSAS